MSELKIDINKLELFIEALRKMPAQNIDMSESEEPNPLCGTVGCQGQIVFSIINED